MPLERDTFLLTRPGYGAVETGLPPVQKKKSMRKSFNFLNFQRSIVFGFIEPMSPSVVRFGPKAALAAVFSPCLTASDRCAAPLSKTYGGPVSHPFPFQPNQNLNT